MGGLVVEKPTAWFNARKAAQVAAFFALQEGGYINVLKLTKLLYLADRKHLGKYDYPILDDQLVSMPRGPVDSQTFRYINGHDAGDGWNEFISEKKKHVVRLVRPISVESLDELSDAEIETLQEVWSRFGSMDQYTLRDWTHHNCPEWEDPQGSSYPIPYKRVFRCLDKKNPDLLEDRINEDRSLNKIFA